ncbi:MAG: transglutaminase domain-containing protein [Lawsonibacter sp.]|jgi:hypothetical protein
MNKFCCRTFCFVFLIFVFFLSGCESREEAAQTNFSIQEIVEQILYTQPDRPADQEILWLGLEKDDGLVEELEIYGLKEEEWTQGVWANRTMGWKYPFSILVLRFQDNITRKEMEQSLLDMIQFDVDRMNSLLPEFSLYIRDYNYVLFQPPYAAMVVCPDKEKAAEVFFSCFTSGDGFHTVWQDEKKILGTVYPYLPPQEKPDHIYDCEPILDAWKEGNPERLNLRDQEIYQVCLSLKEKLFSSDLSSYETELSVHDWMLEHVGVSSGGSLLEDEAVNTPYGALVQGKASCLGFATTFQLLMKLAGEECILVAGASSQSEDFHAWNMIHLDGKWHHVDVSWEKGRFWPYTFLNVTDEFMAITNHQWEKGVYPTAEETGPQPT